MNLAEEFALLAYDDDGKPVTDGTRVHHGIGGAVLVELALTGRVEIRDGKVVVTDPAPTGDAVVDGALALIGADPKARRPGHRVARFARDAREQVLAKLVEDGILQIEKKKVFGVFPYVRYPAPYGREPVAVMAATAVTASGS